MCAGGHGRTIVEERRTGTMMPSMAPWHMAATPATFDCWFRSPRWTGAACSQRHCASAIEPTVLSCVRCTHAYGYPRESSRLR